MENQDITNMSKEDFDKFLESRQSKFKYHSEALIHTFSDHAQQFDQKLNHCDDFNLSRALLSFALSIKNLECQVDALEKKLQS